MISALLLHTKALKRANFKELSDVSSLIHSFAHKRFQNFIHENIITKGYNISLLLGYLKSDTELNDAFDRMGLTPYTIALEENKKQINSLTEKRISEIIKISKGIAPPAKEIIIDEIHLFLKSIEITVLSHPEIDYKQLINVINNILKRHRAQLRNRISRRATAIRKEMIQKELVGQYNERKLTKDLI